MALRRVTGLILIVYIVLTAYSILRIVVDLPYMGGLTPLLTGLAFLFAFLHAGQRLGWARGALLVALTFTVALLFESVGVATGLVYGPYHYTGVLGAKFLGLVPYLIPLAWFMMMLPSFLMAGWLVPPGLSDWKRGLAWAALGGVIMTSWDLTMDPMMVASEHWVWEVEGAYFGIPLQNYIGWWLTVFVTFGLFLWITRLYREDLLELHRPVQVKGDPGRFDRLAVISYLTTGLGNAIVAALFGLVGPALIGGAAMLLWVLLGWWATSRQPAPSRLKTVWF